MSLELSEETFSLYAIKFYDNPHCKGMSEFHDDLKRFRYLKRLFRKYKAGKGLKERLVLNHIIILYNLFGVEATTKMLFFKIERKYWSQLKSFLYFLNYIPIGPIIINQEVIEIYEIEMDQEVLLALSNM
jgi:hypothetical protein